MHQDLAAAGDLGLAQDLCARLCHDLGGPLGSVTGALELLEQEPEAASVARDSAEAMGHRLRLWRLIMGGGGALAREELGLVLGGALPGGRTQVDVSGLPAEELSAELVRALLAAALLGGEALPRGGVVHVAGDASGVAVWPEGRGSAWSPALTAALAGEPVCGPRTVLAPLLLRLAAQAGMRVELLLGASAEAAPLVLRAA
ncbi:hypothetical protein LPC08_11285 [Roseomonas sp. OT10]|uniref:histidine phosphotransferase family protein n=1 Tax=Roseomonas cutis TaxID=2897332 RepID=UPI001E52E5BB|nr:histidine phosphotransferase family protein [Roseomonas sp. OT10]UFN51140.1 hypothetical protein LPC08_11285 [Roseomonas sp. OT10]